MGTAISQPQVKKISKSHGEIRCIILGLLGSSSYFLCIFLVFYKANPINNQVSTQQSHSWDAVLDNPANAANDMVDEIKEHRQELDCIQTVCWIASDPAPP
jgi:hypothetical protein